MIARILKWLLAGRVKRKKIKLGYRRRLWCEHENQIIISRFPGLQLHERAAEIDRIASEISRTKNAVYSQITKLKKEGRI